MHLRKWVQGLPSAIDHIFGFTKALGLTISVEPSWNRVEAKCRPFGVFGKEHVAA